MSESSICVFLAFIIVFFISIHYVAFGWRYRLALKRFEKAGLHVSGRVKRGVFMVTSLHRLPPREGYADAWLRVEQTRSAFLQGITVGIGSPSDDALQIVSYPRSGEEPLDGFPTLFCRKEDHERALALCRATLITLEQFVQKHHVVSHVSADVMGPRPLVTSHVAYRVDSSGTEVLVVDPKWPQEVELSSHQPRVLQMRHLVDDSRHDTSGNLRSALEMEVEAAGPVWEEFLRQSTPNSCRVGILENTPPFETAPEKLFDGSSDAIVLGLVDRPVRLTDGVFELFVELLARRAPESQDALERVLDALSEKRRTELIRRIGKMPRHAAHHVHVLKYLKKRGHAWDATHALGKIRGAGEVSLAAPAQGGEVSVSTPAEGGLEQVDGVTLGLDEEDAQVDAHEAAESSGSVRLE